MGTVETPESCFRGNDGLVLPEMGRITPGLTQGPLLWHIAAIVADKRTEISHNRNPGGYL